MGRKPRNRKRNRAASTPDQIHNEQTQKDEPIDPDQEQFIQPIPEEQNISEPNHEQEEIHQDPPENPLPNPSQEEQETPQDSHDDPEQNKEQTNEVYLNLQKHPEQEEVHQESVVEQGDLQALIKDVVEQQESLIAELDEDEQEEVRSLSHQSFEMETEPATIIPLTSHENRDQEAETLAVPLTSEESQETEVKSKIVVPPALQESTETGLQTLAEVVSLVLQQSTAEEVVAEAETNPVSQGGPKQDIEINTAKKETRNKTSINSKAENVQQKQSNLIENFERPNETYPGIVPTDSNFLRPSFEEARGNILEQDHQNIVLPSVASALLALRELRCLLGLENIRYFPALEGTNLITQPIQRLQASSHIPLLSFQESSRFVSLPEELEQRSELQERQNLEQPDKSDLSPQSHLESQAPEALAVGVRKPMKARARKHKKEGENSKPGHADSIEYQKLLDYKNPLIEDTGEPDFADSRELFKLIESNKAELSSPDELEISDPRELLKDLNFGEMKANNQETKLAGNLNLETNVNLETEDDEDLKTEVSGYSITEHSGNLETEAREDSKIEVDGNLETEEDEDLEMENYEDLEMHNHGLLAVEECEPPLPPPPADGSSIPEDLEEDSSNELLPNDEGNSADSLHVCTPERREVSEELDENRDPHSLFVIVFASTLLIIKLILLFFASFTKKIKHIT